MAAVGLAAMVKVEHKHHELVLVDLVEDAPCAGTYASCVGVTY